MKKLPILLTLLFVLSILTVAGYNTRGGHCGPSVPRPVVFSLDVNGVLASNNDVEVKNLATGEVLTVTDVPQLNMENGIAGFDLNEFDGCDKSVLCDCFRLADSWSGYPGDEIQITLCDYHTNCFFKFNLDNVVLSKGIFKVGVNDSSIPIEKIVEVIKEVTVEVDKKCPSLSCPDYTCAECPTVPVSTQLVCPDKEGTDTISGECPDGTVCDCPESGSNTLWVSILVGILSAGGGVGIFFKLFNNKIFTGKGTGVKTYRGRDGELKIHHKHPGTRGYHDTNINHKAPETHPKGKTDCSKHYFKNEKGLWEYSKTAILV